MHFPKSYISVFLCALSLFSGMVESGENSAFTSRITKQRTMSCPPQLDTRGIESEKGRKKYYWQQALAEFPYERINNAVRLHTDIFADQVLTSTGGYFIVNDDQNSVSQLYCEYVDANTQSMHLAFSFRSDVKFHVTGYLPSVVDEKIFPKLGKLDCAATSEYSTPQKPHCRSTLASLLITNQVKVVPVQEYPQNTDLFGYINYKASLEIPEYTGEPVVFNEKMKKALIKPGETRFYPVSMDSIPHGVSVDVRVFDDQEDLTERCINGWLSRAHFLVKYGASPHILISGEIGSDGNPRSEFKCELRCNEKEGQRDCWDVWFYEKIGFYITSGGRADLQRAFMLTKVNEAYEADVSSDSNEELMRKYQAIRYYKALQLKPGASVQDVKKAHRALSLQFHPDKGGSDEQMRVISTAHKRLLDLKGDVYSPHDEL